MHVYIDTASRERIRAADRLGVVDGVTTNSSIVAGTDRTYRAVVGDPERAVANAAGAAATRAGAVTALTGPDAIRRFTDDVPWLS